MGGFCGNNSTTVLFPVVNGRAAAGWFGIRKSPSCMRPDDPRKGFGVINTDPKAEAVVRSECKRL